MLEDEIAGWAADGVDSVVSLLEAAEAHDLGLQREGELCRTRGMTFVSFPIPDYSLPERRQDVLRLAHSLVDELEQGRSIVIHCRAGIGRSSVIAACTIISMGIEAADALSRIEAARGARVPDTGAAGVDDGIWEGAVGQVRRSRNPPHQMVGGLRVNPPTELRAILEMAQRS